LVRRAVLALAFLLISGFARAATQPEPRAATAAGKKTEHADRKAAPGGKRARLAARYAPVELYQINTKETLRLRFFDDRGKPVKGWQKRFDRFMRCHQTGTVYKMDPRLAHMLYEVGRHYEGHRLEVISGYRHPKVARNPKSPHKQGVACDFRVPGVANAALRDYLRKTFQHVGVGYYPNSVFVHMDDRKKGASAFWIDCAGPGQAAAYAENPREGLKNGEADRLCARSSETAGRAEGDDDMAQATHAGFGPGARGKAGNIPGGKPVEVKTPTDTFGD
jgi:uncharacterized protein YcbK (DUF882 family)